MDSATTTPISHTTAGCRSGSRNVTLPAFGPVRYALLRQDVVPEPVDQGVGGGVLLPGGGVGDHHRRLAVPADRGRRHRPDSRRALDRAAQEVFSGLIPLVTTISGASKPGPNPRAIVA